MRQLPIPIPHVTGTNARLLHISIRKQRCPVRDSLFSEIESGGRQCLTRKSFHWFLLTKHIHKREASIRFVTDTRKINEIIPQLHIKLRPAHHTFQMGINSGNRRTFLRGGRFCKGRIVRQWFSGLVSINNGFYQLLLITQSHKIGCQVACQKIPARHRINRYILSLIFESFRWIKRWDILLHETVNQLPVALPQSAI